MSLKSRHLKSKLHIKRVDNVTTDEVNRSPLLDSIKSIVHTGLGRFCRYKVNAALDNGDMASRTFTEINYGKDVFNLAFTKESTAALVKVTFSNGETEYGLKFANEVNVVHRKDAVLEPFYIKVGVWSTSKMEFVECPPEMMSARKLPAWLLKRLSAYNEKVRDLAMPYRYTSMQCDEMDVALLRVMDSDMVSHSVSYGVPSILDSNLFCNEKVAYEITTTRNSIDHHMLGNWQTRYSFNDIPSEYVISPCPTTIKINDWSGDEDAIDMTFGEVMYLYKYVKSVYKDRVSRRTTYKVYPISSVLNIVGIKGWAGDEDEEVELWNNLDQTISGNV